MKRFVITTVASFVISAIGLSSVASAEQYTKQVNGRDVVVHTNPVPVVMHRVVPPYLGKHVTARQLQSGRLPPGLRK